MWSKGGEWDAEDTIYSDVSPHERYTVLKALEK